MKTEKTKMCYTCEHYEEFQNAEKGDCIISEYRLVVPYTIVSREGVCNDWEENKNRP